ncbi:glycosyltransferase [bacterium]|nr:glycosyltransferase [bacterium]
MSQVKKRIFVALYHSYFDTSSGAAIALRDMMEALSRRGWEVRVLTGPRLDFEIPKANDDLLKEQGISSKTFRASFADEHFRLLLSRIGGIDCGVWLPQDEQADPSEIIGKAWLSSYKEILNSWNPDIVLTYGGFWMTRSMMKLAKQAGAKTMFLLCNYAYGDATLFKDVDVTIVRSDFHAEWCRRNLGVDGKPLYSLIPPSRYLCDRNSPRRYVTFINPQQHKGAYVFAKIAEVLGRRRPDIPLLVVEGRGTAEWLQRTGVDLSSANLFRMKNTPDPRDYLKETRIMLVPSVWQESFGRVAAEAMMNGIPVVGSDRGSLPEVIGECGFALSIPSYITPNSSEAPTEKEVAGWVSAVETLWDDSETYDKLSKMSIERSKNWSEESIVNRFEALAIGDF